MRPCLLIVFGLARPGRADTFIVSGRKHCSLMKRMKELEDENRRLKKMYAEERLKAEMVQEALAKKW